MSNPSSARDRESFVITFTCGRVAPSRPTVYKRGKGENRRKGSRQRHEGEEVREERGGAVNYIGTRAL